MQPTIATPVRLLALLVLAGAASPAAGQFSEPPVLLYGRVLHQHDGHERLLQEGRLEWSVAPANDPDSAFTVAADLERMGDEFSYRLEIPVARVPDGFTAKAALGATPQSLEYETGTPAVEGNEADVLFPDGDELYSIITYTERDRGKILRFDLVLTHPFEDTSGDGLPDWWAEKYGLDPFDPSEAERDLTGDGIDAFTHYLAGTDPTFFFLTYEEWIAGHGLSGRDAAPGADPDGDGYPNLIEFLLDTDPTRPDRERIDRRLTRRMVVTTGAPAFQVGWEQPPTPRWGIEIAVEASGDLSDWETVWTVRVTETTSIDELVADPDLESEEGRFYRLAVRKIDL